MNQFARGKLIEAGLEAERIHVNPNFLTSIPEPGDGAGGYALFAGRLSPEKGIATLLTAWEELAPDLPLKILGDGPEAAHVARAAARHPNIEWLGWRPLETVMELTGGAKFIVLPSVWYEGFNRILLEGLAKGTPIIASNSGQHAGNHRASTDRSALQTGQSSRLGAPSYLALGPKPRSVRVDAACCAA